MDLSRFLFFWLLALAAGIAIEQSAAVGWRTKSTLIFLLVRATVHALGFLLWFSLCWRPAFAAFAWIATVTILAAISRAKARLVGEPMVFSDFALARMIVRNPELYFMKLGPWRAALALFLLLALIALWLWAEPPMAPVQFSRWLAAETFMLTGFLAAWIFAMSKRGASLAETIAPRPALSEHMAKWGLLFTMIVYVLRWRAIRRVPVAAPRQSVRGMPLPETLVVMVQIESFMDPERYWPGAVQMPNLAEARRRAVLYGPLRVPTHGAYTMRTEFAALSGLSQEELGFESFDPYLSVRQRKFPTLATLLAARNYRTIFIHPFSAKFFSRDLLMPSLGFQSFLSEDDFAGAARYGPYVTDAAVAERVLSEARAANPAFIFAATMENHGPWKPGRLPGIDDPVGQYQAHLANSDRMIGMLVSELSRLGRRTILCLFGDHTPILKGITVDFAKPETDYVLLQMGGEPRAAQARPLAVADLNREILRLIGIEHSGV